MHRNWHSHAVSCCVELFVCLQSATMRKHLAVRRTTSALKPARILTMDILITTTSARRCSARSVSWRRTTGKISTKWSVTDAMLIMYLIKRNIANYHSLVETTSSFAAMLLSHLFYRAASVCNAVLPWAIRPSVRPSVKRVDCYKAKLLPIFLYCMKGRCI